MAVSNAEAARKKTGSWLSLTGDGNKKLNPSVTPRKIAAVKLANLKKLFPMLRGEMNRSVSSMPTPSWENKKKNVEEIIVSMRPYIPTYSTAAAFTRWARSQTPRSISTENFHSALCFSFSIRISSLLLPDNGWI